MSHEKNAKILALGRGAIYVWCSSRFCQGLDHVAFELGAAGWKVQTNPLSYWGALFIWFNLGFISDGKNRL